MTKKQEFNIKANNVGFGILIVGITIACISTAFKNLAGVIVGGALVILAIAIRFTFWE